MPDIYIIGGPNGAGKTTTALRIFPALGVTHFINADAIAQGLSPLDVAGAARAAGRLMLEQMETRLGNGDDFALDQLWLRVFWRLLLSVAKTRVTDLR